jgi:hypothetical protein
MGWLRLSRIPMTSRSRQVAEISDALKEKKFFYLCEILTIGCHNNHHNQWVETNRSNICICPTDICFTAWWYYTDSIDMDVKYRCLRMLDWLVSTHPITAFSVAAISMNNTLKQCSGIILPALSLDHATRGRIISRVGHFYERLWAT